MEWWQAIVLGLVEGITEYLPVSSTGHLLLAERLLGLPRGDAADAYAVCIQGGAILAVVGLYFRRMVQMLRGVVGLDPDGRRLLGQLVVGVAPAVVFGLLLEGHIKGVLFGLLPVAAAWLAGGVAILLAARWLHTARANADAGTPLEAMTWRVALAVGLAQCLALWPGTSRSLVTIVSGVLLGLSLEAAVELSLLLGVVVLTGAAGKDAVAHGALILSQLGVGSALLGVAVAGVSAATAVAFLVAYLRRHSLAVFGWYRIVLALGTAGLLVAGVV